MAFGIASTCHQDGSMLSMEAIVRGGFPQESCGSEKTVAVATSIPNVAKPSGGSKNAVTKTTAKKSTSGGKAGGNAKNTSTS